MSGIDNNVLENNPSQVYIVAPALAAGTTLDSAIRITFEVEAQVAVYDIVSRNTPAETLIKTYTISGTLAQFQDNEVSTGNPVAATYDGAGTPTDGGYDRIVKILSFKLKTPKLMDQTNAVNNEFNKMRFFSDL